MIMKQCLILLLTVGFFSCGRKSKPVLFPPPPPAPKFFVSGTYVAFEQSAYCRTWDTLRIFKDRRQINVYGITRRTKFQHNLEDDYFAAEKHCFSWIATYDPAATVMRGLDDVTQPFSFSPGTTPF